MRFKSFFLVAAFAIATCCAAAQSSNVKFEDEESHEVIEVSLDVVSMLTTVHVLLSDLGMLKETHRDAISLQTLHIDAAQFKKIAGILQSAKQKLGVDDVRKVDKIELFQGLEEGLAFNSADELLHLINAVTFVDVKALSHVLVKHFVDFYSDKKCDFIALTRDIQRLIIQYMTPLQFISLINANKLDADDLYSLALWVHFQESATNISAREHYHQMLAKKFARVPQPDRSCTNLQNKYLKKITLHRNSIYVATEYGLAISHNNGATFTTSTTVQGLGSDIVNDVAVHEDDNGDTIIFAATNRGLSISTNWGVTFTNKTITQGLAHDKVYRVITYESEGEIVIEAATEKGLSRSIDFGRTFVNEFVGSAVYDIVQHKDKDGLKTRYVATSSGLYKDNRKIFESKDFAVNRLALYEDRNGFITIIGTSPLQIVIGKSDGKSFDVFPTVPWPTYKSPSFNFTIYGLLVHENALGEVNIFMATTGGLFLSKDFGNTLVEKLKIKKVFKREVFGLTKLNRDDGSVRIYLGTKRGLSVSDDNGENFTIINERVKGAFDYKKIALHAQTDKPLAIVAKTKGSLRISQDGGKTFIVRKIAKKPRRWLLNCDENDDCKIYLAYGNKVIVSADFGETFCEDARTSPRLVNEALGDVVYIYKNMRDADGGIIITCEKGVLACKKNGTDAIDIGSYWTEPRKEVSCLRNKESHRFIMLKESGFSISENNGDTFVDKQCALSDSYINTMAHCGNKDGQEIMCAGLASDIAISVDQGDNWEIKAFPNATDGIGLIKTMDNQDGTFSIYAATVEGTLHISHDNGNTFHTPDIDDGGWIKDIVVTGQNENRNFYILKPFGLCANLTSFLE